MNRYYDIKLIIIGDSKTGKSTFINQIINNKYKNIYEPTIGVDFYTNKKYINNNKIILNIWDISGDKRFQNYTETYIRNSTFALIFFDINNEESFYNLRKWYNRVKTLCPNILNIVLIGSKIDIYKDKIDFCSIKSISKEYNVKFFLISSKDKKNINKPINYLLNSIDFQNIDYYKKIGINKIDVKLDENNQYEDYCCNIF